MRPPCGGRLFKIAARARRRDRCALHARGCRRLGFVGWFKRRREEACVVGQSNHCDGDVAARDERILLLISGDLAQCGARSRLADVQLIAAGLPGWMAAAC